MRVLYNSEFKKIILPNLKELTSVDILYDEDCSVRNISKSSLFDWRFLSHSPWFSELFTMSCLWTDIWSKHANISRDIHIIR